MTLPYLSVLRARRGSILIAGITMGAILSSGLPAAAADGAEPSVVVQELGSASGLSEDVRAISQAADEFTVGDASSTVALVEAAAAETAQPIIETGTSTAIATTGSSSLTAAPNGDITIVSGGNTLGIEIDADAREVAIVDGAVVASNVAPSTDLVTRATDDGVQVVAVLADESAPTEITFPLDLPDGAELVEQTDGSIAILAPVQRQVALVGEKERLVSAASEIIGHEVDSLEALDDLTDEQIEHLAAIPDERTATKTVIETIAEIAAPWAVDASGAIVPTHYTVDGDTIVQTVVTTAETAFPVVADPSWTWWVKKAVSCVAGAATLIAAGYAKIAVGIAKLVVKMKAAKTTSSLGKAYAAWKKLGSSNSAIFKELTKQIKALGSLVIKHGYSGIAKHKASSTKAAAVHTLFRQGWTTVVAVFGLEACLEMIAEA